MLRLCRRGGLEQKLQWRTANTSGQDVHITQVRLKYLIETSKGFGTS